MRRFVFDTETTGVEPGSRLVEIHSGMLDDAGLFIGEHFTEVVDPGMPVPADVVETHGLTSGMLSGCPSAKEVLSNWLAWLDACKATHGIAHFAPYDVGIIAWELGRAGLPMPEIQIIDTCAMARTIKATKKNSLDALVEHYGIKRVGNAHRAASDSIACRDYWLIANGLLPNFSPVPWAPEYRYPAVLPEHLAGLPDAVANAAPFPFAYVDAKGVRTDRSIIPYGYAETDKGISFHGLCPMRNERRTFMADRIIV